MSKQTENYIEARCEIGFSEAKVLFKDKAQFLSPVERDRVASLKRKLPFFAKRIAAKRALFQCLASLGVKEKRFLSISIINDVLGKPYFAMSDAMQKLLALLKVDSIFLSLSDEKTVALAYVVITRRRDDYDE